MKRIFWALSFIVFFAACHKKINEKVTEVKTEKEIEKPVEKSIIVEKEPLPVVIKTDNVVNIPNGVDSNLLISFQRTACYGRCPVFKVEIFKDGKAYYEGRAFSKRQNTHKTTVTDELIQKIQKKASEIKYFDMQNTYPLGEIQISDLPHIISYIRIDNTGKLINDTYDAPRELIDFERWLESELDNLDWKEVK